MTARRGGRRHDRSGDVRAVYRALDHFHDHAQRVVATIASLSFVGGVAEAGVLVLVTAVAVSMTEAGDAVDLGPFTLTRGEAVAAAAGVLAVNVATLLASSAITARAIAKAALDARQSLIATYHRSSFERKSRGRVAELQEAVTTYVDRFGMSFSALCLLITNGLNLTSFVVAALVVNLGAAIALGLAGTLLILVLRPTTRKSRRAAGRLAAQRVRYSEGATETVLLARELAVFGVADGAEGRLRELDVGVADSFRQSNFLKTVSPRLYQAAALATTLAALAFLSSQELDDVAALGAVVLLLVRSLSYCQQVVAAVQQIAEHRPYVDRMVTMIDTFEADRVPPGTRTIGHLQQLELRDVSFAYSSIGGHEQVDPELALRGVDLTIAAGETIGVLGPSGAGKTTLINLLLRLYAPTSGSIAINGIPLADADDEEWHRRIAIVPQEPRLVHGTIEDNIRFLREIDHTDVQQAAKDAHILDFIEHLPGGFQSPVGELGAGLSGGQRQRICIARALAGKPDMLVLDEPTSALDGESDVAIQTTLAELKGQVTMVLVAHRLSTLAICDRLVILTDGAVADIGTPADLAARSEYYRRVMAIAGL